MSDEKKECTAEQHHFGARIEVGQSVTCVCGEMVATLTRENSLAVTTPQFSGTVPLRHVPQPTETLSVTIPQEEQHG